MVNPLQFSMVPQSIQTGNAPIILTGGPQASPGGISLGGNALMPTAVNSGSQLLSVVSGLEQILGSVGSLLQGLKGGLQGGIQNGMMQGIGISGGFNGLPGMGIAGGFNGLSGIGSAGGLGGIPTIGTAGSLSGIPGVGTAGSIGGIGSLMGGLSGSGPLSGLPGTINGMPVAGALGANIAFPGMLGASGIGSFPGGAGIGGGFGSPVGLPQGSIILSGGPGIPGQVQGIPGQIQGIPGQVQGVPGQAQGANGLPSIPKVDPNDFVDFLLAGSQGGQTGTNELIEGRFARPGSKFATAGNNEFQALTAYAYANQFKAFALGKDAVFQPGKDINQLASNLNQAQNTQLAPEAETLANVAALYRGNLTGVNKYDNAKLQQLVASWGRSDLAQTPGAGVSDVESIGIAVKAINEQPDPQIRQAWLQQIFDFQNNSPSSPSGAVPNVRQYQDAINLYRGGGFAQLLNNYNQGIQTQGPVQVQGPGGVSAQSQQLPGGITPPQPGALPPAAAQAAQDPGANVDFRTLNSDQRTQLSGRNNPASAVTAEDRALIHMYGRGVIGNPQQPGARILDNLRNANKPGGAGASPEELALTQKFAQMDMERFGGITGRSMEEAFFDLMATKFQKPGLKERYLTNKPPQILAENATAELPNAPVDSPEWQQALQRQNGLDSYSNAILRYWGHEAAINGTDINGSVVAADLAGAPGSLDKGMDKSAADALIKAGAAEGDLGKPVKEGFLDVLDQVYGVGPGASVKKTFDDAQTRGAQKGFSLQQMAQMMGSGVQQAMASAASFVKDHPMIAGAGAAGMMAATAVCPFLAGMGAGAGALAMGQKMMNGAQAPQQPVL